MRGRLRIFVNMMSKQMDKKKKRKTKRKGGRNKRIWPIMFGSMAVFCVLLCMLFVSEFLKDSDGKGGIKESSSVREKADVEESLEKHTSAAEPSSKKADEPKKTKKQKQVKEQEKKPEKTGKSKKNIVESKIQKKIHSMSLAEKVAQMFIITPESLTGYSLVTMAGKVTKDALDQYPVGGLIYMGANIKSESQVTEMIQKQQRYSRERIGLPLFISVDEEGGQVTRIASCGGMNVTVFPDISKIGASKDKGQAYELGDVIGEYLSRMGFNLDLAPVADVLTNVDNTVVKRRSYGSDPKLVSEMVKENLDGLWKHQVYGCIKHFPGHGATAGDTHQGYAYTNKTWEELDNSDVIPFRECIKHGVKFIMVGHISLPNVTKEDVPASLSSEVINGILREKLGYDGIVMTDALNMGAVLQQYTVAQAAVQAVLAGNDILLMAADFKAAYEGILQAVQDGIITEERLDESVGRILKVKLGL